MPAFTFGKPWAAPHEPTRDSGFWPHLDGTGQPEPLFVQMMRAKIRDDLQAGRKPKAPSTKGKQWLYPFALERAYFALVKSIVTPWMHNYAQAVAERYPKWHNEGHHDGALRLDDAASENAALFERTMAAQKAEFDSAKGGNFLAGIFGIGSKVNDFNDAQFQGFVKQALGAQFHPSEPWVNDVLDFWSKTNYTLVKSLAAEGINRLNANVTNAVQNGLTYPEVMREIRKTEASISGPRAKLLARDQIGKLNGKLTQRRQEDAGVEMYVWQTVGDERVRGNPAGRYPTAVPSHYAIDGKLCKWGDNSVYSEVATPPHWVPRTGKMPFAVPGWEIQCRCSGLPFMEPLFDELAAQEKEIADAQANPPAKVAKPRKPRAPKVPIAAIPTPPAPIAPAVAVAPVAPAASLTYSEYGRSLVDAAFEERYGIKKINFEVIEKNTEKFFTIKPMKTPGFANLTVFHNDLALLGDVDAARGKMQALLTELNAAKTFSEQVEILQWHRFDFAAENVLVPDATTDFSMAVHNYNNAKAQSPAGRLLRSIQTHMINGPVDVQNNPALLGEFDVLAKRPALQAKPVNVDELKAVAKGQSLKAIGNRTEAAEWMERNLHESTRAAGLKIVPVDIGEFDRGYCSTNSFGDQVPHAFQKRTWVHETTHALHETNPKVGDAVTKWFKDRALRGAAGKTPTLAPIQSELFENPMTGTEMFIPAMRMNTPYSAKFYGYAKSLGPSGTTLDIEKIKVGGAFAPTLARNATAGLNGLGTEVLTTGVEGMYESPNSLFFQDADHFNLTLAFMDGKL